ncbi:MAG: hypothetical protein WCD81_03430 [Candidatus Bathyarchaeia archaeon]
MSLQRIKDSQTTLTLIVATVLFAPAEVVLFYAGILVSTNWSTMNGQTTQIFVLRDYGVWYLAGWSILPILYCIIASLYFSPKRIVSPLNTQIFAWLILSVVEFLHEYDTLYSYYNYYTHTPPPVAQINTMISTWASNSFALFFIFVFAGLGQLLMVRLMVGPNLIGVWRKTYAVNAKCEVLDSVLCELEDYRRHEEDDGLIVYKMPTGFVDKVLMVLGPDPRNKDHSLLATVAYHSGVYSYEQSDESAVKRNRTIFEIEGRLRHADSPATIEELKEELYDPATARAYDLAIKPTRTPFKRMEKLVSQIPPFYKWFMAITSVLIVLVQVAYFTSYFHIDTNTWISTTVLLLFAFFAEAAIPLRDEIQARLKERLRKEASADKEGKP